MLLLKGCSFIRFFLSKEPRFGNVLRCRCKWLMTASFTLNSIHEMILVPWIFFFFSWLLSRQWHHPTVDPSPAWWYRKPIVCARIGIEFMCVCAVFKDLTKSQENVGLDRSYRGISLKLPLLYATICECRLPKALWFLSIDSQFHWFRVKILKGKTRFG